MTYTCHMLTCHIYLFSDSDIYLSHVDMSYTLYIYLVTMTYHCHMLTCHIYLFNDNEKYLSHVDMSYILIKCQ